jgi:hypothetical protein
VFHNEHPPKMADQIVDVVMQSALDQSGPVAEVTRQTLKHFATLLPDSKEGANVLMKFLPMVEKLAKSTQEMGGKFTPKFMKNAATYLPDMADLAGVDTSGVGGNVANLLTKYVSSPPRGGDLLSPSSSSWYQTAMKGSALVAVEVLFNTAWQVATTDPSELMSYFSSSSASLPAEYTYKEDNTVHNKQLTSEDVVAAFEDMLNDANRLLFLEQRDIAINEWHNITQFREENYSAFRSFFTKYNPDDDPRIKPSIDRLPLAVHAVLRLVTGTNEIGVNLNRLGSIVRVLEATDLGDVAEEIAAANEAIDEKRSQNADKFAKRTMGSPFHATLKNNHQFIANVLQQLNNTGRNFRHIYQNPIMQERVATLTAAVETDNGTTYQMLGYTALWNEQDREIQWGAYNKAFEQATGADFYSLFGLEKQHQTHRMASYITHCRDEIREGLGDEGYRYIGMLGLSACVEMGKPHAHSETVLNPLRRQRVTSMVTVLKYLWTGIQTASKSERETDRMLEQLAEYETSVRCKESELYYTQENLRLNQTSLDTRIAEYNSIVNTTKVEMDQFHAHASEKLAELKAKYNAAEASFANKGDINKAFKSISDHLAKVRSLEHGMAKHPSSPQTALESCKMCLWSLEDIRASLNNATEAAGKQHLPADFRRHLNESRRQEIIQQTMENKKQILAQLDDLKGKVREQQQTLRPQLTQLEESRRVLSEIALQVQIQRLEVARLITENPFLAASPGHHAASELLETAGAAAGMGYLGMLGWGTGAVTAVGLLYTAMSWYSTYKSVMLAIGKPLQFVADWAVPNSLKGLLGLDVAPSDVTDPAAALAKAVSALAAASPATLASQALAASTGSSAALMAATAAGSAFQGLAGPTLPALLAPGQAGAMQSGGGGGGGTSNSNTNTSNLSVTFGGGGGVPSTENTEAKAKMDQATEEMKAVTANMKAVMSTPKLGAPSRPDGLPYTPTDQAIHLIDEDRDAQGNYNFEIYKRRLRDQYPWTVDSKHFNVVASFDVAKDLKYIEKLEQELEMIRKAKIARSQLAQRTKPS